MPVVKRPAAKRAVAAAAAVVIALACACSCHGTACPRELRNQRSRFCKNVAHLRCDGYIRAEGGRPSGDSYIKKVFLVIIERIKAWLGWFQRLSKDKWSKDTRLQKLFINNAIRLLDRASLFLVCFINFEMPSNFRDYVVNMKIYRTYCNGQREWITLLQEYNEVMSTDDSYFTVTGRNLQQFWSAVKRAKEKHGHVRKGKTWYVSHRHARTAVRKAVLNADNIVRELKIIAVKSTSPVCRSGQTFKLIKNEIISGFTCYQI